MFKLDRRNMLKLMGTGVATLGVGGLFVRGAQAINARGASALSPGSLPAGSSTPAAATPTEEPPWWLVQPYRVGSSIAGSRLLGMAAVRDGVVTLELEHPVEGRFGIKICRRDEGLCDTPPPARSRQYDFLLANGGKGDKPTSRAAGETVLAIAAAVRRNETRHEPLSLVTMRERWQRLAVTR
jgi:hypothetical protein